MLERGTYHQQRRDVWRIQRTRREIRATKAVWVVKAASLGRAGRRARGAKRTRWSKVVRVASKERPVRASPTRAENTRGAADADGPGERARSHVGAVDCGNCNRWGDSELSRVGPLRRSANCSAWADPSQIANGRRKPNAAASNGR